MKKLMVLFFMLGIFISFFSGCHTESKGEQLARQHCQSCHMFPEPAFLDKNTWVNYVLPKMGNLVGFTHFDGGGYTENGIGKEVMLLSEWNEIVNYYRDHAPDTLVISDTVHIQIGLPHFEINMPVPPEKSPATTFTKILPGQLLFGNGMTQTLYQYDVSSLTNIATEGQGLVQVISDSNTYYLLDMGVLYPSDEKKGRLSAFDRQTKKSRVVIDSLQRPVYAEFADLNNDQLPDIIICEFGNVTGQLGWYENDSAGKYIHHVLRPLPGAVRFAVTDFNHDKLPDILALMAQGDEGIFLYVNKGKGRFEEKRLLQFPPSYGCNYFELDDFNGDGFADILVTNGDNGDYPPVMKPYHGIRIYLNDGKFQFTEKLFLHQNGVEKAMARDFDGDGDLDIASISYFPDYEHHPEESFLYWENVLPFSFRPYAMKEAVMGRWLTMDAADADGDGDTDIILGNAAFPLGRIPEQLMEKWKEGAPPVLLLKNKQKSIH